MYTFLIALIYLAFISLGLPDSLLGSAWPVIYIDINVPVSYMGIISILISVSTIISSLMSDKITRKFGTSRVTVVSVFLTAVALLGFSCSDSFGMLIIFSIPYGLGAGAIDAALNNYVAIHYSSKHMSWLHCFWGVGTIISPFVMSYALETSVWQTGYRVIAFIQLAIALVLLLTLPVWKINQTEAQEQKNTSKSLNFAEIFKIKGVVPLLVGFFAYCAVESTAISWACTYLVSVKGVDEPTAAAFASLLFIGMTVGRFIGGFIMDKLGDKNMIFLGSGIITSGVLLFLIPSDSYVLSLVGLIVIGLGCAPVYPCIIHSTPSNFGAENSGSIIGVQMASAYLGTTLIPPLFGLISKRIGFDYFPICLIIFTILLFFMIRNTFKLTQSKEK